MCENELQTSTDNEGKNQMVLPKLALEQGFIYLNEVKANVGAEVRKPFSSHDYIRPCFD